MIKIEKGNPPSDTGPKLAALTRQLKTVYAALIEIYQNANSKNEAVALTDPDIDKLISTVTGKTPKGKASRAALLKQLPSFVFGSELIESLAPSKLPTDNDLASLKQVWVKSFQALIPRYEQIRQAVAAEWAKELATGVSGGDPAIRERVRRLVAERYRYQALRDKQPFLTFGQARFPEWFQPDQMESWPPPENMPASLSGSLFAAYQQVLERARESCLAGKNPWLVPTVWMAADPGQVPTLDQLFGAAMQLFRDRLARRAALDKGMTAQEVAALLNRQEVCAYYFLGARAFGEVLDEAMAARTQRQVRPMVGFKSDAFDSNFYSGHGIKEALLTSHFGKCAFCESKVRAVAHGDVEHFRPKAGYDQGRRFNYDGYFWLAYDWANLYFSCQICNQMYKENHFPVLLDNKGVERRTTFERNKGEVENPVLIDPGKEDPREHIRFDPRTGEAYPFSLLTAYLRQMKKVADPGSAIWVNAGLIPETASSYQVNVDPVTQQFVITGKGHELWDLLRVAPGPLLRGVRTIQILGLNRAELVRRRVAHLRALRGLFVAATAGRPESGPAQAGLEAAMRPAAEFSSLAIDAVNTWVAEADRIAKQPNSPAYPWIERYNTLLAQEPEYPFEGGPAFNAKDIGIMYFIPAGVDSAHERRLVYLKQDEEIDTTGQKGWYLQVPDEDLDDLVAQVWSSKQVVETIKVGDLFEMAQPWRKFSKGEVWVEGPFSVPAQFG